MTVSISLTRPLHRLAFHRLALAAALGVGVLTLAPATEADAMCVVGVAHNDVLNMRSGPGTSYEVVGQILPGRCGVRVRESRGGWRRVTWRGRTGWVNRRFLGANEEDEGDGADAPTLCVVGVASNDVLNIRSRPTSRSSIRGSIPPGRCGVRTTGSSGNWLRVRYRGVSGWVNGRFLSR